MASTLIVEPAAPKSTLLPEAFINLYEAVNACTRIVRKTAEGTERLVDGLDEITTLMLRKQRLELLAGLDARPALT